MNEQSKLGHPETLADERLARVREAVGGTIWTDDLFDAIDERVTAEMRAAAPGTDDRFVWATVGAMSVAMREIRKVVGDA